MKTKCLPESFPSGCQDVIELNKVLLHEILALQKVVFRGEILHALLLETQTAFMQKQAALVHAQRVLVQYHKLSRRRCWAVWVGTVQEGSSGILQDAQVWVHVRQLHVAVGAAAAIAPHWVTAHVQHLVLLMHQKLVGVLGGLHPPHPLPLHVDGTKGQRRLLVVSGMMMVVVMLMMVIVVVVAPFRPPSSAHPPPLQAPPAALRPAVLLAAVPLQSLVPVLQRLGVFADTPAHLLWEHFLVSFPFLMSPLSYTSFTSSSSLGCSLNNNNARIVSRCVAQITNDPSSSHSIVYLLTIFSLFFLTSGFGWCIASSASPCSSSLPARLALCNALLCLSNVSFFHPFLKVKSAPCSSD